MFLTQGNAYGTQGSVGEEGLMIKVEKFLTEQISETNILTGHSSARPTMPSMPINWPSTIWP